MSNLTKPQQISFTSPKYVQFYLGHGDSRKFDLRRVLEEEGHWQIRETDDGLVQQIIFPPAINKLIPFADVQFSEDIHEDLYHLEGISVVDHRGYVRALLIFDGDVVDLVIFERMVIMRDDSCPEHPHIQFLKITFSIKDGALTRSLTVLQEEVIDRSGNVPQQMVKFEQQCLQEYPDMENPLAYWDD
jgi:hypothetical protein